MIARALMASLLFGTIGVAHADVSRDVRRLPERREIHLPPTSASHTWVEVRQDDIFASGASPDFGDVRIVTENDDVIPFIVPNATSLSEESWAFIDSIPVVWERIEQRPTCTLRLDADMDRHLLVLPGDATDYEDNVRVRSRQRAWSVRDAGFRTVHVSPAASDRRLALETRAHDLELHAAPGTTLPTGYAALYRRVSRCVPLVTVPSPVPDASFEGREWQGVFRLPGAARTLTGLTFAASDAAQRRPHRIHLETERGWRASAVQPTPACAGPARSRVVWQPIEARAVRIRVDGADPPNQPLQAESLLVVPTRARAWIPTTVRTWIAYGDPELERPAWRVPEPLVLSAVPIATLGPPEPNPLYDPDAFGIYWLQRHPGVLTGIMFALLGLIALVLFRWRPRPTPE